MTRLTTSRRAAPSVPRALHRAEDFGSGALNQVAPVRTLDDLLKMRDVMDWVAIVRRGIAARIVVEAARRFDLATAELGSVLGLSAPTLYRLAREENA